MADDPRSPTSPQAVAVGIIDPDTARAEALAAALTESPAATVAQIAATLDPGPMIWSAPEVVLVGATGDIQGLRETCRAIDELLPACRVAVVDATGEESVAAITAGAHTQIRSAATPADIVELVIGAVRGESEIGADTASAILAHLTDPGDLLQPSATVTETEREVLIRLGRGDTYAAIAEAYNVTARLVRLYVGYAVAKHQRRAREEAPITHPVGLTP